MKQIYDHFKFKKEFFDENSLIVKKHIIKSKLFP